MSTHGTLFAVLFLLVIFAACSSNSAVDKVAEAEKIIELYGTGKKP